MEQSRIKKIVFAVEDEESIRELYQYALSDYEVYAFETGGEMRSKLEKLSPDLFLLDIMLPDTTGGDIVEFLKGDVRYRQIPIIMVSAKGDEISKVKLLNLGADDYIAKPFGVMELIARINANLRKSSVSTLAIADVLISPEEHSVRVRGQQINVTLKEYELLKYLILNANKTVERDRLLGDVWGIDFDGETRTLDAHVKMLREKLDGSLAEIETVRGVGYKLKAKERGES